MNHIGIRLAILGLLMIGTGCATGKKSLQEGDYTAAVLKSVERLRDNPESKQSIQTLRQAYPLAVKTALGEIDQILRSQDPRKYAGTVRRYETLNQLASEIRHCPAALRVIDRPDEFPEELAAAREKAAPEAYDAGVKLLRQGNRQAARDAFYLFIEADQFIPGYSDVEVLIPQARLEATLKVLIEQIPVRGRYQLSSQYFYDQVVTFLNSGVRNEFVRFYDPSEAEGLNRVNEILLMEFDDFVVGSTRDKESEKEVTSRDSVKVGTATVNGQKVDVYNRVKAKLTTHRREVISTGLLAVRIVDANTNKPLASRNIPGTFTWASEWANFNGDERALTQEQLNLCKKRAVPPPPPQDLFIEFTKPIYDQLKGFLRNYYKD